MNFENNTEQKALWIKEGFDKCLEDIKFRQEARRGSDEKVKVYDDTDGFMAKEIDVGDLLFDDNVKDFMMVFGNK